MKHRIFFLFSIAIVYLGVSSCGSKRDIIYFQDFDKISAEKRMHDDAQYRLEIMPNDNLFITVSAVNSDAVTIFNMINTNRGGNLTTSSLEMFGYLVDSQGNINLPLVGEIHVAGLTKGAATRLLQSEISKFVTDAVVNIRFLNYKIEVLGEVNRPGVYTVTDEKITVPQAIALAGDLTIYGDRHRVQLIRMENGEKRIIPIDLTSADLFFSPFYYLQQNDVLYISPNRTRAEVSTYSQYLPLLTSLTSLAFTMFVFFVRK